MWTIYTHKEFCEVYAGLFLAANPAARKVVESVVSDSALRFVMISSSASTDTVWAFKDDQAILVDCMAGVVRTGTMAEVLKAQAIFRDIMIERLQDTVGQEGTDVVPKEHMQ